MHLVMIIYIQGNTVLLLSVFTANSALTHKPSCTSDDKSELGVPRVYDKRHRVNITLPTREVDSVLKQCRPSRGKDNNKER